MSKGLSLAPKKSKRVKWLPPPLLSEVKLFMLDDCPSKIGSKPENFLQTKTSLMLQSDKMNFDGAPPGFGSEGLSETLKQTCVPQIKWKSPPMFILNSDWRVVAGELSEETRTQKHREVRVLEALYPRPSVIPSSPSVSPGLGECDYDDRKTPRIPIIPIEEDDAVDYEAPSLPTPICSNSVVVNQDDVPLSLTQHNTLEESKLTIKGKSGGMSTGLGADICAAAASAAFTAIMKSNEKGSLIDTDLLVKILSDPKMIEKLSKDLGVSSTTEMTPVNEPKPATSVFAPTIEYQSTMPQKPIYENSNVPNLAERTIHFASNTFSRSEETHVLNLPISNAKPLNENTNQLYKDLKSSASAFTVSSPINTLDRLDKSTLMQVISSTSTSVSSSGSKTAFPSTFCASLSDTISPKMRVIGLEFPPTVPSSSSSHFPRCNDLSPKFFPQTDKQFLHNLGRETFQPSSQTNTIALSPNSSDCRTEKVSPTCRDYQSLPQENHSLGSFLHYTSPSDRPLVYPASSVKTSVVKDKSYLKSLIELHGVERQVDPGEYMKYRLKASEGEAKVKVPKPCRYFNSSQGCRNGSSCPFQHDPLLKMRAGSLPGNHSSKRFKLSREIS